MPLRAYRAPLTIPYGLPALTRTMLAFDAGVTLKDYRYSLGDSRSPRYSRGTKGLPC